MILIRRRGLIVCVCWVAYSLGNFSSDSSVINLIVIVCLVDEMVLCTAASFADANDCDDNSSNSSNNERDRPDRQEALAIVEVPVIAEETLDAIQTASALPVINAVLERAEVCPNRCKIVVTVIVVATRGNRCEKGKCRSFKCKSFV